MSKEGLVITSIGGAVARLWYSTIVAHVSAVMCVSMAASLKIRGLGFRKRFGNTIACGHFGLTLRYRLA